MDSTLDARPVVGWVDSLEFDRHEPGPGHPERPARLEAIRLQLERTGLRRRLEHEDAPPVTRSVLARVHDPRYIARVEALSAAGGGELDEDTLVGVRTFDVALLAAGAVELAVTHVLGGSWTRAFCSVRPPGHHALPDRGAGFCIFNNVAVGVTVALADPRIGRVAVVDFDGHHGNGTEEIFRSNDRVLYAGWHQHPLYPDTDLGSADASTPPTDVVNCALAPGAGDDALLAGWSDRVRPALSRFEPDIVLVSAGFDADRRDPLTDLEVTTDGFARLSSALVAWADEHCAGRVVSVLEGGYELWALAEGVGVHVQSLLGDEER